MNASRAFSYPTTVPFYHTDRPSVFPNVPDTHAAVAAPFVAYWVLSLFFYALDVASWKWLDRYRIHDSEEVKSKNLATRSQVIRAVLLQQAIQTGLGLAWVTEEKHVGPEMRMEGMERVGAIVIDVVWAVLGKRLGTKFLQAQGADTVYFIYWWATPLVQFLLAMCVSFSFLLYSPD